MQVFSPGNSGNAPGGTNRDRDIVTKIEVLGIGCEKCRKLYENVEKSVKELNLSVEIIRVDDFAEIVSRGVMIPPALFIDGEARAEGRVPDVKEIKGMLTQ